MFRHMIDDLYNCLSFDSLKVHRRRLDGLLGRLQFITDKEVAEKDKQLHKEIDYRMSLALETAYHSKYTQLATQEVFKNAVEESESSGEASTQ